jgi:hypothetical protein
MKWYEIPIPVYFVIIFVGMLIQIFIVKDFSLIWFMVYLILGFGSGAYFVTMYYIWIKTKRAYGLFHVIFAISIGLLLTFIVSIDYEYVPNSYIEYYKDQNNMSVIIDMIYPLIIPVKAVNNPVSQPIKITIDPYDSDIHLDSIRVYSTEPTVFNQSSNKMKFVKNTTEGSLYTINFIARHDGKIFSQNVSYVADITYINESNGRDVYHNTVPFNMTIISNDLTILTYFWIVLVGVVISRFIDFILSDVTKIKELEAKLFVTDDPQEGALLIDRIDKMKMALYNLDSRESLWIIFSFILSILVFASFKETIETFTDLIIINITIAFAFGFSFDRTIELATRFKPLFN